MYLSAGSHSLESVVFVIVFVFECVAQFVLVVQLNIFAAHD